MCPRKETMNLNFAENLVGLRVYPSVYDIKKTINFLESPVNVINRKTELAQ